MNGQADLHFAVILRSHYAFQRTHEGEPSSDLEAALEDAWITGLERNGNIVLLAISSNARLHLSPSEIASNAQPTDSA
jgi:hypothetical protein